MCGRFIQTSSPRILAEHFDVDEVVTDDVPVPSYNVAPRAEVLTIFERDDRRRLDRMRWGLVPSWSDTVAIGDKLINARAETLSEKPAFKAAFERRRCIIPADGFYEWQVAPGSSKQPMYIHARNGVPIAFAGLWESWRARDISDAPWIRSCVVITTSANATLAPVHDRMPVILEAQDWDLWLNRDIEDHRDIEDLGPLVELLHPAADDLLEFWPVSTRVSSARNDDASLIVREDPLRLFG